MAEILHLEDPANRANKLTETSNTTFAEKFSGNDFDTSGNNAIESSVFTSPEAQKILDATEAPKPESRLGNALMRAAERINESLVSGIETREAMAEAAKDKLTKFGNSALNHLVNGVDITIGLGLLSADAIGRGANYVKDQTVSAVSNKIESAQSFVGEKVTSISEAYKQKQEAYKQKQEAYKQKQVLAEVRKNHRISMREQKVEDRQQAKIDRIEKRKETIEIGKEKLSKIGHSAMNHLVNGVDITIGLGLLGADAIGRGAKNVQEAAIGIKNKAEDKFDNAKKEASIAFDGMTEKASGQVDKMQNFASEKISSIQEAYAIRKIEAEQRKEARITEREQKKAEFQAEVKKRIEDAKQRVQARKEAVREKAEAVKEKVRRNARNVGNSALYNVNRVKEAGERVQKTGEAARVAAYETWKNSKPKTSNV